MPRDSASGGTGNLNTTSSNFDNANERTRLLSPANGGSDEMNNNHGATVQATTTCCSLFLKPFLAIFQYIREFSFIGMLLTYSAVVCLVFSLVIFAMQQPTLETITPIYNNVTGGNDNNSNNNIKQQQEHEFIMYPELEGLDIVRQYHVFADGGDSDLFTLTHKDYLRQEKNKLDRENHKAVSGFLSRLTLNSGGTAGFLLRSSGLLARSKAANSNNEEFASLAADANSGPIEFGARASTTAAPAGNITGYLVTLHTPINYVDSLFMSVTSFSASGLNSVNYNKWSTGAFIVLGLIMTLGDIVLLTALPALIRYRALTQERERLVKILLLTGEYDIDNVSNSSNNNNAGGGAVNTSGSLSPVQTKNNNNNNSNNALSPNENSNPHQKFPSIEPTGGGVQSPASPHLLHHHPVAEKDKMRRTSTNILYGTGDGSSQSPVDAGLAGARTSSYQQHHVRENSIGSPVTAGNNNDGAGMGFPSASAALNQAAAGGTPRAVALAALAAADKKAKEVAEQLTFGKRIVYEDGLANINQQIDISLIIMFGTFTYFLVNHVFFTLMCMAGGKTFGWSLFHVVSAFNNAGLAMAPTNMIPIRDSVWLMFNMTLVIPLGNTLFPVFFRFQMSLLHRLIRRITRACDGAYAHTIWFGQPLIVWQHSVRLFLRYPRKYYTHMFPKHNTLVLFLLWVLITLIGFLLFIPEFSHTDLFPAESNGWTHFWMALFQTVSVRTTGFAVMDLDYVATGQLAWWILAMYTSAYPLLVTVRASANQEGDEDNTAEELRHEATHVIGRDLFWLYLAVMLIAYGEGANIKNAFDSYDLFLRICFEVSSAFGNVGLSLSMPGCDYSYSGSLTTFSLLVMIAVMYCGKHRGLPLSVDEAIQVYVRQYEFTKDLDPDAEDEVAGRSNNNQQPGAGAAPAGRRDSGNSNDSDFTSDEVNGEKMRRRRAALAAAAENNKNINNNDDLLLAAADGTIINAGQGVVTAQAPGPISNTSFAIATTARGASNNTAAAVTAAAAAGTRTSIGTAAPSHIATDGGAGAAPSPQISFWVDDNGDVIRVTPQELLRRRVCAFYEHYNPARLRHVDRILMAFEHNPTALIRNLASTYGPEPGSSKFRMRHDAAMSRLKVQQQRSHPNTAVVDDEPASP